MNGVKSATRLLGDTAGEIEGEPYTGDGGGDG